MRYRTLSGGIGRSPSPTNSDYLDDDDDDVDDELTANTAILNGKPKPSIDLSNASTCTNNSVSSKTSRPMSHLTKASKISYQQKASVHNVRIFVGETLTSHHKSFSYTKT